MKMCVGPCFFTGRLQKLSQNWAKLDPKTHLCTTHTMLMCCLPHFAASQPPKRTPEVIQNRIKESAAFQTSKSHLTSSQNGVQKSESETGVEPLDTFGTHIPKRFSKVSPNIPKGSQMVPQCPKSVKKNMLESTSNLNCKK